jgi:hypothetical protein
MCTCTLVILQWRITNVHVHMHISPLYITSGESPMYMYTCIFLHSTLLEENHQCTCTRVEKYACVHVHWWFSSSNVEWRNMHVYMYIGDSPLVILIVLSLFLQFRAFHVTSFFSVGVYIQEVFSEILITESCSILYCWHLLLWWRMWKCWRDQHQIKKTIRHGPDYY